jgi:hypothetical protein
MKVLKMSCWELQVVNRSPWLSLSGGCHGINSFEGGNASRRSSSSFEITTGTGNRNGLVHDPFANAKVPVDPAGELLVLTSDSVSLEGQTG